MGSRIGPQSMVHRRTTDRFRVEIGALQEHLCSSIGNTRTGTTEHPGNTQSFFCITDHQVFAAQLALFIIQGHERCIFRQLLYNDAGTADRFVIECMQGLS
ncbi:hypothetical protein D3C86_1783410 [compost metagenome]